jgi:hypothetical protein
MLSLCLLSLLYLSTLGVAHPGSHDEGAYIRTLASSRSVQDARQKLARCSDHIKLTGVDARTAARRSPFLNSHRDTLDAGTVSKSPRSFLPQAALSSSENPSCLLTPESTIGPFWVDGHSTKKTIEPQRNLTSRL